MGHSFFTSLSLSLFSTSSSHHHLQLWLSSETDGQPLRHSNLAAKFVATLLPLLHFDSAALVAETLGYAGEKRDREGAHWCGRRGGVSLVKKKLTQAGIYSKF